MILDEVLKETAIMNSLNEAQQEYVMDAYAAGYIAALENYIESLEEEHNYKQFTKEVVDKLKQRAQDRLDKTRKALQRTNDGRKRTGLKASETPEGEKYNDAHRHMANINSHISKMKAQHHPAFA